MIEWREYLNFRDKKFLNGALVGSVSAILVCVLCGFIMFQTVLKPEPPPIPLVTAEQVVQHGYGKIIVDVETKKESFVFLTYEEVYKNYQQMKKEERISKFKNFFKKIGDFFKKPFQKK